MDFCFPGAPALSGVFVPDGCFVAGITSDGIGVDNCIGIDEAPGVDHDAAVDAASVLTTPAPVVPFFVSL